MGTVKAGIFGTLVLEFSPRNKFLTCILKSPMEQYIKLFPFHSYNNITLNDAACLWWKTKIYPRLFVIFFLNLTTARNRSEAVVFFQSHFYCLDF